MKAKKILSLFLCAVMLVSIVPMSALSTSAAQTENNETSATYYYQANSMYALEMYLKVAGNVHIKLTGDCVCSHEIGSEGHTALSVYGNKTIDLNGYTIVCKDESNSVRTKHDHPIASDNCVATRGQDKKGKFLISVKEDSTLTINDSSNGNGKINYTGKIIGYTDGPYANQGHYRDSYRNLFEVFGKLIVNNGNIEAGNVQRHYFMDARRYENKLAFHGYGREQVWGTAVEVKSSGKFIMNGGTVSGRGGSSDDYYGEKGETIYINSGGKAYINDGLLVANGCANMFAGYGVDGGLTIRGGNFKLDKHDKIRLNDIVIDEWSTFDGTLYYAIVHDGYYGSLGIPDSAWKPDFKHKRVVVHDHDADKWTSYFGDREIDFEVDLSGNQYNEVSFYGNNQYNTDAIFLQGTYGSTALGKKSIFSYYPDTVDKFKVTYDYKSDPYFVDGNTTTEYTWKIWQGSVDSTPDYQITTTSNSINPVKPTSSVDFSGKIIYVRCTVMDKSNYSDRVYYTNSTYDTYISPTTSVMGLLEYKDQTPPMDKFSTTTNIRGMKTGETFEFSFNNVPLPTKYANEGYTITRGYEIYKAGMTRELIDKKTGITGTSKVSASFVPKTAGLYDIYENLYLDKNGTRVQVAHNIIYLSVEDSYQIFEAKATCEAPVHGMLPSYDAVTDTEHVRIKDVDWSKKHNNGEYYLMDEGETFVAGQYYECIVEFETTDNYTFIETPTGTINGIERILFNHDKNYAAFGVRFKCPLGVIFTEESGFVAGCTLEVDIEKMAELDDELMEAYFNDEVMYKWFYNGRLQRVTKDNTYEIPKGIVGHYLAVKVCYGDKTVVSEEVQVIEATTTALLGDVNADGRVNVLDTTIVQKYVAGFVQLTDEELTIANVNKDARVNVIDATQIQKYGIGLITE